MLRYKRHGDILRLCNLLQLATEQHDHLQYIEVGLEILAIAEEDDLYISQYVDLEILRLMIGNAHLSLGDFPAAIHYSSLVRRCEGQINRAYAYFFSQQYEKAHREASEAMANIDYEFIGYLKAAARWLGGDKIGAVSDIKTALAWTGEEQKNDCHGYFVRGLVKGWIDQSRAAMKDFFTCIQLCEKTNDQYLKPHAVRLFQKLREKQKTAIVDGLG